MAPSDIVFVCESVHHGNTRLIAEAMSSAAGGCVIRPGDEARRVALNSSILGFGSGIYFGSHHKRLLAFAESLGTTQSGRAFIFSTSGTGDRLPRFIGSDYHRRLRRILRERGYDIVGEFSCRGFDTFGPWGKLGGIAKGRPNATDIEHARAFVLNLLDR